MKLDPLELAAQVLTSRTVSRADQHLMTLLLTEGETTPQERILIERVLYGVRHGLIELTE